MIEFWKYEWCTKTELAVHVWNVYLSKLSGESLGEEKKGPLLSFSLICLVSQKGMAQMHLRDREIKKYIYVCSPCLNEIKLFLQDQKTKPLGGLLKYKTIFPVNFYRKTNRGLNGNLENCVHCFFRNEIICSLISVFVKTWFNRLKNWLGLRTCVSVNYPSF